MLFAFELSGLYFGGWSRGRISGPGISSTCMFCLSFGPNYFWADAGDSLEMNYDVATHQGKLSMWITRLTSGKLGDVEGRTEVGATGEGIWRAPISRPGLC